LRQFPPFSYELALWQQWYSAMITMRNALYNHIVNNPNTLHKQSLRLLSIFRPSLFHFSLLRSFFFFYFFFYASDVMMFILLWGCVR
jgi:hypothetical protein